MERKNIFARIALNAFFVVALGSLLNACATTDAIFGKDNEKVGYNTALELRSNVVYVTGRVDNDSRQGLGFIVGENEKELFVVTPNHVVRPMDPGPGDVIPESAQIEFLHAQGEFTEAQIIPLRNENYDVAILSVPRPENFKWQKKAIGQPDLELADKVWTIDADRAWTVTSEPGSISKLEPSEITTSGLSVRPGHSGTPLITETGIIGMIYSDETFGKSFAYPVEVLKSQVEEWGKPWDLEDNYASQKIWLWVVGGVATVAIIYKLLNDGGNGGNTGTITVTAPVP